MFIRAPLIVRTGPNVETLARWRDQAVLVREGSIVGSTFHPELTDDERVHRYFLDRVVTRRAPA
jgi:5'-phosphate synthase pdxT subunit